MKRTEMKVPVLILMMILSLLSCKKESVTHNIAADVFVKSMIFDGQTVYGLAHYVSGYAAMNSVIVHTPDNLSDQLIANDATKMYYSIEPSILNGSFSTTLPVSGTYSYGVTFDDGVEKVVTDVLGNTFLSPPALNPLTKSLDGNNVVMTWAPLEGADYMQVTILKGSSVIYTSALFAPPTARELDIPISLISTSSSGTFTYELDAIHYESVESGEVESISTATADIDL